ncbi:MAG TPA: MFS transporter [Gemmatimonadales bacterium]|jgi:MFS family permease|nr:MFS transporter [Gemmatimonadales bacterium]
MTARARVARALALERNTASVVGAMFLMALGENLWRRFVPKYLEALGAPVVAIGAYGSTEDLLDGLYQYPGGWVGDRYGRRRAMLLFVSLAAVGYAIVAAAPAWPVVLVGLVFVMCWTSMASPTLFAVVGDALPRERRAVGFSVQAILRRLPILVAPTLGGLLIVSLGVRGGVRAGLMASIALAGITLLVVRRMRLDARPVPDTTGVAGVWRSLPTPLRRLLLSDVFIRTCDGMVDVFLVLYAVNVVGIGAPAFGVLIGIQAATVMACSLPAARLADRLGRKPFVVATFIAFSCFPLAVVAAHSFAGLALAFVVGGLREIGEPARKALILEFVRPDLRARGVGLYYLIRSLAIAPAATVGGLLWKVTPAVPFLLAGAIGLVGTVLFALTVEERHAG